MKTFASVVSFLALFVLFTTFSGYAQDCAGLLPVKEGVEMEVKQYNAKDKLQGTSHMKVLKKKSTPQGYELSILVRATDDKGKNEMERTLTFQCKNGVFIWDLSNMMQGSMPGEGMEGMEIRVSGAEMSFPSKLSIGQSLDDSEMKLSMESNGMVMMSINMAFVNRKVVAREKITTPAGTYDCYKITYDIQQNGMFSSTMHQVDWMAEGIGMVKTQTFDQKDKLQHYTLLTSFKE